MTQPAVPPTRCRQCKALLTHIGDPCTRCTQYAPAPPPAYAGARFPVVYQPAPVKSVGVAVLLTFVWLGAGHLYAERVVAGVLLLGLNFFLVLLSFTGIGLLVSVPVWGIAVVFAMIMVANAVNEHDHRVFQPRPLALPY